MLNSSQNNLSPSLYYDVSVLNVGLLDSTINNNIQLSNLFLEEKCFNENTPTMSPLMANEFLIDAFPLSPPVFGAEFTDISSPPANSGASQELIRFVSSDEDFTDINSIVGDLFDGSKLIAENKMAHDGIEILNVPQGKMDSFIDIDILGESMKMWSDDGAGREESDFLDFGMEESVNNNPLLQWHLSEQTFPEMVIQENLNIESEGCDKSLKPKQTKWTGRKMTRKPSYVNMSASSSTSSISSLNKTNPKYVEKREKNNESVRKSRDKARRRQMETMEKLKILTEENDMLNNKVNDLLKELEILKNLFANISSVKK